MEECEGGAALVFASRRSVDPDGAVLPKPSLGFRFTAIMRSQRLEQRSPACFRRTRRALPNR